MKMSSKDKEYWDKRAKEKKEQAFKILQDAKTKIDNDPMHNKVHICCYSTRDQLGMTDEDSMMNWNWAGYIKELGLPKEYVLTQSSSMDMYAINLAFKK